MVKLDVSLMSLMEDEDFRVLTAVEMAMRNHELAPTALIERIADLPHGGCRKRLKTLLKHKILHHENTAYDGYAMKYAGYDLLALRTFSKRGSCTAVGHRIGCGKESDIILVRDGEGRSVVLKLQRLGRCSFRSVMRHRDYKGHGRARHGASWFYLSRLASQKEFACLTALYAAGFPVPRPLDHNRHAVLMSFVPGTVLNHLLHLPDPAYLYRRCLALLVRLARVGLIHGDFNEFNLLVTPGPAPAVVVIDFPQMVSVSHPNAAELFARDVDHLATFFARRFKMDTTGWRPTLGRDVVRCDTLDRQVLASGYISRAEAARLEGWMHAAEHAGGGSGGGDDDDEEREERAATSAEVETAGYGPGTDPDANFNNNNSHTRSPPPPEDEDRIKDTNGMASQAPRETGETGGGFVPLPRPTASSPDIDSLSAASRLSASASMQEAEADADGAYAKDKDKIHPRDTSKPGEDSDPNTRPSSNSPNSEDEDQDETSCSTHSLDLTMARNRHDRALAAAQREAGEPANLNFLPDGRLNHAHIQDRIRKDLRRQDNRNFNRGLRRNTQKGREKQKIRRQVKSAGGGFFD